MGLGHIVLCDFLPEAESGGSALARLAQCGAFHGRAGGKQVPCRVLEQSLIVAKFSGGRGGRRQPFCQPSAN